MKDIVRYDPNQDTGDKSDQECFPAAASRCAKWGYKRRKGKGKRGHNDGRADHADEPERPAHKSTDFGTQNNRGDDDRNMHRCRIDRTYWDET